MKLSRFLMIFLLFFSCKEKKSNNCKIRELKMLYTTECTNDLGTGLEHYILIKNFSRYCLDSAQIMNVALKYRDTIGKNQYSVAIPANILRFYNSDKNFSIDKASPDNQILNKDCLVVIKFGYYLIPNYFTFYNKKGEIKYAGIQWQK